MQEIINGFDNAVRVYGAMVRENEKHRDEAIKRLESVRMELETLRQSDSSPIERIAELEEMELIELETIANYDEII